MLGVCGWVLVGGGGCFGVGVGCRVLGVGGWLVGIRQQGARHQALGIRH